MTNKKIKNIIVVNDFDYVQGGASKVALDTARLLKDTYSVTFFSAVSNHQDTIDGVRFVSTNQMEALRDKNKLRGMLNGLYNFKVSKEFRKLLVSYNPDETIIHIHGWTKALSSSVFYVAFKKKFKVVLTLHDYFIDCPNGGYFNYKSNKICKKKGLTLKCIRCNCDSRNYLYKIYRIIRHFVQNKMIKVNKKLKHAIGISDLNIDILHSHLPNAQIVKILNPVDLNLKYSFDLNNKYYLYLGRVSKEKGVDIFASAMTKMKKKAIVVGDGSELEVLKKKYPSIEFVGWKNKQQVNQYLKKARALIMPSLWYEGSPLTPLEAMSFGVPCIISNVCAGREYISNNGFTFNPYDESDLIEKISLLEQDIKTYSINSFEYVKQFNESNYVKEVEKLYKIM